MRDAKKAPGYSIQALDRAFRLLDQLAESRAGLGLTEIAGRLRLHKSTAHRLIMVLESHRAIERDFDSGKWHLGSRLTELGMLAFSERDLYGAARPSMEDLVDEAGETAHLGVISDGEVVSLCQVESQQCVRAPITPGARTPAHCTALGKAMLAFWPPLEVDAFLRGRTFKAYTRRTITGSLRLTQDLRAIRKREYSIDEEEFEEGMRSIGAPIWDESGEVAAAIAVAGPTYRVTESRVNAIGRQVVEAAMNISTRLGYNEAEHLPQRRLKRLGSGRL